MSSILQPGQMRLYKDLQARCEFRMLGCFQGPHRCMVGRATAGYWPVSHLPSLSTPSHPLLWSAWHAFLGPGLYVEVPPTCPSNSCSLCISNLGAGSGEAPSGPGSGHGILLVGSWPGVWSTPVLYDGVATWGRWAPVEMCYKCKAHTGFWRLNMKSEDHKRSH